MILEWSKTLSIDFGAYKARLLALWGMLCSRRKESVLRPIMSVFYRRALTSMRNPFKTYIERPFSSFIMVLSFGTWYCVYNFDPSLLGIGNPEFRKRVTSPISPLECQTAAQCL